MEFKGSRTEANLMAAFSGEAMAESRYNFYAQAARSEGLLPAAEIFEETARNEAAHAKLWFGALGKLGGTLDNLKDAQAGERFEWTDIYARFEREALDEGFERTAALFRMVGAIERMHDERYGALIRQLEKETLYRKMQPVQWICPVCGRVHEGTERSAQGRVPPDMKRAPKALPRCGRAFGAGARTGCVRTARRQTRAVGGGSASPHGRTPFRGCANPGVFLCDAARKRDGASREGAASGKSADAPLGAGTDQPSGGGGSAAARRPPARCSTRACTSSGDRESISWG